MAATWNPVTSQSSVQVTGPTSSQAVELVTIQTIPTGVIATIPVMKKEFDDNTAGPLLTTFADNIEAVISQGKAIGGTGTSSLDGSGLIEYFVTFTVSYDPPGVVAGDLTADVDVPIGLLSSADAEIGRTLVEQAEALVDDTYTSLVSMTNG